MKITAPLLFSAACAALSLASAAYGQARLPVTGTSGGPSSSADCGSLPAAPTYSFQVGPRATSVSISVTGTGDQTLLMLGPDGSSRECVLAHDFNGGVMRSGGLFKPGTYNLYVGDLDGQGSPFTLDVSY